MPWSQLTRIKNFTIIILYINLSQYRKRCFKIIHLKNIQRKPSMHVKVPFQTSEVYEGFQCYNSPKTIAITDSEFGAGDTAQQARGPRFTRGQHEAPGGSSVIEWLSHYPALLPQSCPLCMRRVIVRTTKEPLGWFRGQGQVRRHYSIPGNSDLTLGTQNL